jgi:YVTN family beta-propeller protein
LSFPNIPNITPLISVSVEQTIPLLLSSIAFEELALAHIMNAEAEKLQFVLGTLPTGIALSPSVVSLTDLLVVGSSVQRTLRDVIKKEMLLEFKFENVMDLLPFIPSPTPPILCNVLAYVANNLDGTVSVIDTTTNTVIATVPVGNSPFEVAITPNGTRAYVTNQGSNNVSVIDTATNTVIATVNVGDGPFGVAITPNGTRVYVTNQNSNNVSVIDTATNTVIATVTVGSFPQGIAITPDGTRAYVVNFSSNNVSVIDTTTNTVIATVNVGAIPFDVAITPDGTRAYVTIVTNDTVAVIDTTTNTVIATVTVGNQPLGIAIGTVCTGV